MTIGFADFVVDPVTRQLLRAGQPVPVSPKIFDLLFALAEAAPRVLSKEELLHRVWSDAIVSDGTVAAAIAELRGILGDEAKEPRFIRTVHRFGYAFCAATRRVPDAPAAVSDLEYRLILGDREISLAAGENVLGRAPESVLWLDHGSVSRRHARIVIGGENAMIEDLGSKNGTFVRGERIHAANELADGDRIALGRVQMTFRVFRQGEPTKSFESS